VFDEFRSQHRYFVFPWTSPVNFKVLNFCLISYLLVAKHLSLWQLRFWVEMSDITWVLMTILWCRFVNLSTPQNMKMRILSSSVHKNNMELLIEHRGDLPQEMVGRPGADPRFLLWNQLHRWSWRSSPGISWGILALTNLVETGFGTPDGRVWVKSQEKLTVEFRMMSFYFGDWIRFRLSHNCWMYPLGVTIESISKPNYY